MKIFTDYMFYSLLELSEAKRFEAWLKARDRYIELKRQNKDDKYAQLIYETAKSAMQWNS